MTTVCQLGIKTDWRGNICLKQWKTRTNVFHLTAGSLLVNLNKYGIYVNNTTRFTGMLDVQSGLSTMFMWVALIIGKSTFTRCGTAQVVRYINYYSCLLLFSFVTWKSFIYLKKNSGHKNRFFITNVFKMTIVID